MKMLCKFKLIKLEPVKHTEWEYDQTTGRSEPHNAPAVDVELSGDMGDPFGSSTPQAHTRMRIVNPVLVRELRNLWDDFIDNENTKNPEFFVTFELVK